MITSSRAIGTDAETQIRTGQGSRPRAGAILPGDPDMNRDKRPDILVCYVELPGSVYFNTGHGRTFHEVPWNDGKGTVYGLAFPDFDGDGWPDIVAARSDAPNGIWFNTKLGALTLCDHKRPQASRTTCFDPGKLNWDWRAATTA